MRDGATGRSRGFGFLTFRDPKTVNTVMVKEHFLDGKIVRTSISDKSSAHPSNRSVTRPCRSRRLPKKDPFSPWKPTYTGSDKERSLPDNIKIDPKRAIPRDEQEKTSKIFVGGVSQEASEQNFKEFFQQFGRVVDATLMMDKDTGRPRGFGFVTFDSEAAVEKCLDQQPLEILGKMIEVKKAQPRGKMGEEEDNRGGRGRGKFGRGGDDRYNNDGGTHSQQGGQASQQAQNTTAGASAGGMTPQMMAQYWQRMQQYFAMMQQQMAASAMQSGMGGMGMNMNPQMMAQMAQMQQMQQMQKQMQQSQQQGSMSPAPQSPGAQAMGNMGGGMQGMNPQMQQMMQMMQNQQQGGAGFGMAGAGPQGGVAAGPGATAGGRPGFNAQEQMAFEQQKYEQQLARQHGFNPQHNRPHHSGPGGGSSFNQNQHQPQQQGGGGPTSWEGMYDEVPQPNVGGRVSAGSGGVIRNLTPMNGKPAAAPKGPGASTSTTTPTPQPSNAPANAPTGPKNAGRPGANFRGGRGGGRFHPYGR
jgi:RNA-binding protein Musashi